ncbi:iron ABC transporter permease [Rheinheimera texasensis]|uniref:FecCD family ABC transporter permease n=1 Tax=Rheinheimera texasensis TaxID=306205 RepID=UPI0032B20AF8
MKNALRLICGAGLLFASLLAALQIGAVDVSLPSLLLGSRSDALQAEIFWQLRLPRVLLAGLAGAALAVCGALLQLLSRNALADPYLFGVVSGAALGATISSLWLPALALPVAAFAGAIFAILLVLALAQQAARQGMQSISTLLLTGLAVSFFCSAVASLLLYQADSFAANRIMFWLMGSLSRADWPAVQLLCITLTLTLVLCAFGRRQLTALNWSDDMAKSLGVAVQRWRLVLLLLCALLTAVVVAYCGGIGFVGLMIPHLVRLLFGSQVVPLLFGSALCGAIFLIWVDSAARTVLAPQELPLGILTALCGSIFFLLLLSRRSANEF